MRMHSKVSGAAASLLAFTPVALAAPAAEGGEAQGPMSFEWLQYLFAIIAFLIVVAVLNKAVWPKILGALDERQKKILEEIEAAEKARKQAAAALQRYERSLAEARAEAQAMIDKTRGEQQALASELRAKADAELTRMREQAQRDIEQAKRDAIAEIYNQSAALATELAAKILRREITADDQRRMIDDSLRDIETASA